VSANQSAKTSQPGEAIADAQIETAVSTNRWLEDTAVNRHAKLAAELPKQSLSSSSGNSFTSFFMRHLGPSTGQRSQQENEGLIADFVSSRIFFGIFVSLHGPEIVVLEKEVVDINRGLLCQIEHEVLPGNFHPSIS
jgi:hypothetical protein